MKSIVLERHGSIEELKLHSHKDSGYLKEEEIKINIKYCALNHLDLWLRKGGTGDHISLPRIPGSDIAGVVVDKGKSVTHLEIGDGVLVYPGFGCGYCTACINGTESLCKQFKVIGYNVDGGYSEFTIVKAKYAVAIPKDDLKRWAAVPVSYITAWNALVTKGKLSASDTVAIWGATGGLGYAAASIAQGFGARVVGIVSTKRKAKFLKVNGFNGEIIVRSDLLIKDLKELTNNNGVDLVLDHVGKDTWVNSMKMLAKGGRLAFCGVTTGAIAETDLRLIFGKQLTITGSWMGNHSDFIKVVDFLKSNPKLFPHIHKTMKLEEVGEAQSILEEGAHLGKIVLEIGKGEE